MLVQPRVVADPARLNSELPMCGLRRRVRREFAVCVQYSEHVAVAC